MWMCLNFKNSIDSILFNNDSNSIIPLFYLYMRVEFNTIGPRYLLKIISIQLFNFGLIFIITCFVIPTSAIHISTH